MERKVSAIAKQAQVALSTQQRYVKVISCLKDVLTDADLFADGLLRRELSQIADYSYFSEECESGPYAPDMWIVDPLDGTANYLMQRNTWTVSVAWTNDYQVVGGAVCTGRGHIYTTSDARHLSASDNKRLANSHIGTDWTKRDSDYDVVQILQMLRDRTSCPRIEGCCSHSLLQVARGRLDGFIHLAPQLFDFAAAAPIVEKAGGKVTDALGESWDIYSKSIVATNGLIHDELLEWLGTVLFPADYMRRENVRVH